MRGALLAVLAPMGATGDPAAGPGSLCEDPDFCWLERVPQWPPPQGDRSAAQPQRVATLVASRRAVNSGAAAQELSALRLLLRSIALFAPSTEVVICIPKLVQPPGTLAVLADAVRRVLAPQPFALRSRVEVLHSPSVRGLRNEVWENHTSFRRRLWHGEEDFPQRVQLHKPAALQRALDLAPGRGVLLVDTDTVLLRPWMALPQRPLSWGILTADPRLLHPGKAAEEWRASSGAARLLPNRSAVTRFLGWSGVANTGVVWAASNASQLATRWLRAVGRDGGRQYYSDQGAMNDVLRDEVGSCGRCAPAEPAAGGAVRLGRQWNLFRDFFLATAAWRRSVGLSAGMHELQVDGAPLVLLHLHLTGRHRYTAGVGTLSAHVVTLLKLCRSQLHHSLLAAVEHERRTQEMLARINPRHGRMGATPVLRASASTARQRLAVLQLQGVPHRRRGG